jgi:hypothetical protein
MKTAVRVTVLVSAIGLTFVLGLLTGTATPWVAGQQKDQENQENGLKSARKSLAELNESLKEAVSQLDKKGGGSGADPLRKAEETKKAMFKAEPFSTSKIFGIPVSDWADMYGEVNVRIARAQLAILDDLSGIAKLEVEEAIKAKEKIEGQLPSPKR